MAEILDTKGLKCPLPVLKVRKAIKSVPVGACLTVLATDPLAELDLQHFCNESGHTLEQAVKEAGDVMRFDIRRRL